jgi:hypothetical protein
MLTMKVENPRTTFKNAGDWEKFPKVPFGAQNQGMQGQKYPPHQTWCVLAKKHSSSARVRRMSSGRASVAALAGARVRSEEREEQGYEGRKGA